MVVLRRIRDAETIRDDAEERYVRDGDARVAAIVGDVQHRLVFAGSATARERRLDDLPVAFRTVFVLRDVQDMTVGDTAQCLGIPAATVRTRLFRARALLREALARDLDLATSDLFSFDGARCDRIVASVLAGIEAAR